MNDEIFSIRHYIRHLLDGVAMLLLHVSSGSGVKRFIALAEANYFTNIKFFRVVSAAQVLCIVYLTQADMITNVVCCRFLVLFANSG